MSIGIESITRRLLSHVSFYFDSQLWMWLQNSCRFLQFW